MKKMYNDLVDLLPDLISSFTNHSLFDVLEEDDLISFVPITDAAVGQDMVDQTNTILAAFFEVDPAEEQCYEASAYNHKEDNPVLFWKDYLGCFYDFELVEEFLDDKAFAGTSFGTYRVVKIAFINEVNQRIKKRRLNGVRMEYKVKATPLDSNKHWNRTYDKDF